MPLLQIDFAAGFEQTKTEIEIDDEKVTELILTTDYSSGFADIYRLDLESKEITLKIKIPKKNQEQSIQLTMSKDIFLSVNLTPEGQLKISSKNESTEYF